MSITRWYKSFSKQNKTPQFTNFLGCRVTWSVLFPTYLRYSWQTIKERRNGAVEYCGTVSYLASLTRSQNVPKQGDTRASCKLLLSINCPISCVPTRSSGGWEIGWHRCIYRINHSWDAEHWEEEQLWLSVCKPRSPWHGNYSTETEWLQDHRGIIMFSNAQHQLQPGLSYICDNLFLCSEAVFNVLR